MAIWATGDTITADKLNNLTITSVSTTGNISATGSLSAQNGSFYTNSSGAFWSSDKSLKENFTPITEEDSEKLIDNEYFKQFNWKENGKTTWGVVAQEVEDWIPESVNTSESGLKSVNYDAILSKAVAALIVKIKDQENRIKDLEEKLANK